MKRKERKRLRKSPIVEYKKPKRKHIFISDYPGEEAIGDKFFDQDARKSGCFPFGSYPGEIFYCKDCVYCNSCIKSTQWILRNGRIRRV